MNSKFQPLPIILIVSLWLSILHGKQTQSNIAVLDLDPTGIAKTDAQFLSDRLRTELFETGKFQVIERDKMNEILNEQGFQQTGCTSIECAVEIGQLLNVKVMLAGKIGKIEDIYSISVRMISVESGAILRTATRDYTGKLSEVLTEIIPEVAEELAYAETQVTEMIEKKTVEKSSEEDQMNRFAILLRGGFSSLKYTEDINTAFNNLNYEPPDNYRDLTNHLLLGLEGRYTLSSHWQLKLGLGIENLLHQWTLRIDDPLSGTIYDNMNYERDYNFVNSYLGLNYLIWHKEKIYNIFLGFDIGTTAFKSTIKQTYLDTDSGMKREYDDLYEYSAFTWKLSLGGTYYLSSSISLALDLTMKGINSFDTTDQKIPDEFPNLFKKVIFPKEVTASGLQLVLYLGYHF